MGCSLQTSPKSGFSSLILTKFNTYFKLSNIFYESITFQFVCINIFLITSNDFSQQLTTLTFLLYIYFQYNNVIQYFMFSQSAGWEPLQTSVFFSAFLPALKINARQLTFALLVIYGQKSNKMSSTVLYTHTPDFTLLFLLLFITFMSLAILFASR